MGAIRECGVFAPQINWHWVGSAIARTPMQALGLRRDLLLRISQGQKNLRRVCAHDPWQNGQSWLASRKSRSRGGLQCASHIDQGLALRHVRVIWRFGKFKNRCNTGIRSSENLCPFIAILAGKNTGEPVAHFWPCFTVVLRGPQILRQV